MRRVVLPLAFFVLVGGFECDRPRQGQLTVEQVPPAEEPDPEPPTPGPERPVAERPETEGPRTPAGPLAMPGELATAINALGVDLYGRIRSSSGNLAISPASISTAMAMTYGGARGETAAQMAKVLHFGSDAEALHGNAERFVESVADPGRRPYALHLANRLYGEKTYDFEEPFLALTRERYAAELERVDFKTGAQAVREQINGWVAGKTRDRIRDLLPPPAVDGDTRLVLVNALYFNGPWLEPFTERATQPAPFHVSATESVEVPTMHRTDHFWYAEAEGVRLLGIPYAGEELQMTIVLPNERDGLAAVEQSMTAETLAGWLGALTRQERVALALPRFTIQPGASLALKEVLIELGMPLAFQRGVADFTGMANPENPEDRLNISNVYHKAFVEVTEQGTEAAAATAVVMGRAGGVPAEPTAFDVDHPFLFFVHTRESNAVLFMGRLVDPR